LLRGGRCRRGFCRTTDGYAAHAAEFIAFTIAMTADAANERRIAGKTLRCVICLFRVCFGSEVLRRFERRGERVWIGLGTPQFRLQPAIEFVHFIAAHGRIGRRTGGSGMFLVFIHESNHSALVSF
jgi:hypothetical protein